jgi:hypothetical protein
MTLGGTATAPVRLIVCCKRRGHQVELDPPEMAAQYGAGTAGARGLQCGSRQILSGATKRGGERPPVRETPNLLSLATALST